MNFIKIKIPFSSVQFSSVELLSRVRLFATPWNGICCSVAKSCPTQRSHGLKQAGLPCPFLSPRVFSYSHALALWGHPNISSSVTPFSSCPQSFLASGSFPMSWFFASGGQSIGALASVLLMDVKAKVAQLCPTLCDPMDCIVHGILQARILEWVAFPFSRDLPNPGLPCCRQILYQLSHKGSPRILENSQAWFPLELTGLISFYPRDSQESSPTSQFKSINSSVLSFLYSQLSHPYMTTGKP